jgi:hypothetical protein
VCVAKHLSSACFHDVNCQLRDFEAGVFSVYAGHLTFKVCNKRVALRASLSIFCHVLGLFSNTPDHMSSTCSYRRRVRVKKPQNPNKYYRRPIVCVFRAFFKTGSDARKFAVLNPPDAKHFWFNFAFFFTARTAKFNLPLDLKCIKFTHIR